MNKSGVKSKVDFNLRKYADFQVKCLDKQVPMRLVVDKDYEVTLKPNQEVAMELIFTPTEVASYDFEMPLFVNRQTPEQSFFSFDEKEKIDSNSIASPVPSEFVSSPGPTRRSSKFRRATSSSVVLNNFVPKRKITAIALRHALEISDLKVDFKIPIAYLETLKEGGFYEAKSIYLTNRSHKPVKWCLDMRKSNKVLEEGEISCLFLS